MLEWPTVLMLSLFDSGYGGEDVTDGGSSIGADVAAPVDLVRRDLVYPDGCDPLRRLKLGHELSDEIGIVLGEEDHGQCFTRKFEKKVQRRLRTDLNLNTDAAGGIRTHDFQMSQVWTHRFSR